MNYDQLDQILSQEKELITSSRFVGSVMEAVRREAATPPPIPFPWKRAWAGIAAWLIAVAVLLVASTAFLREQGQGLANASTRMVPASWVWILHVAKMTEAGWITLALTLSVGSIKLSNRLVSWEP